MEGALVGERGIEGGEKFSMIFIITVIQFIDSISDGQDKDSYSAAFISDDLF